MTSVTLVFDLDGTLVDTAPDLIDTLNVVFEREHLPPVPYDEARSLIGGGAKAMIIRGLAAEGRPVSPGQVQKLLADFIEHYSAHIADRSRPFPGVEHVLNQLAAEKHCLAVCTNKLEKLSVKLLETLGLARYFAAICGQDTFGVQKPDPIMLRKTIAAAGGQTGNAIMIGDSETDIRTARAAGVPIVAVDFGYTARPIAEFGPDRILSRFTDLPEVITELASPPVLPAQHG
jgi:phosphoglycolate phosphatase